MTHPFSNCCLFHHWLVGGDSVPQILLAQSISNKQKKAMVVGNPTPFAAAVTSSSSSCATTVLLLALLLLGNRVAEQDQNKEVKRSTTILPKQKRYFSSRFLGERGRVASLSFLVLGLLLYFRTEQGYAWCKWGQDVVAAEMVSGCRMATCHLRQSFHLL